jgi:hypothetical protein
MSAVDWINLILLVGAFVCFVVATLSAPRRFNLVALGLLLWVCVPLFAAIRHIN